MENKNIIRTFTAINLKKKNIELHQNFTGSYKQSLKALGEFQDAHNIER